MPTYAYECLLCSHPFDVSKRIADIDQVEECPSCGRSCTKDDRQVTRPNLVGLQSCTEAASYNQALGCVVRDTKHAERVAKERGYIAVGNEKPDTIHKHFETQRADTKAQRWKEADREKVYGD